MAKRPDRETVTITLTAEEQGYLRLAIRGRHKADMDSIERLQAKFGEDANLGNKVERVRIYEQVKQKLRW